MKAFIILMIFALSPTLMAQNVQCDGPGIFFSLDLSHETRAGVILTSMDGSPTSGVKFTTLDLAPGKGRFLHHVRNGSSDLLGEIASIRFEATPGSNQGSVIIKLATSSTEKVIFTTCSLIQNLTT